MNRVIKGICIVGVALLSACGADVGSTRIISRTYSPDGRREAVYSEDMSGGATVGPTEEVYVVAEGDSPRPQDRVFSQERVCNLKVSWLNDNAVEIGYSARKALDDGANVPRGIEVHLKWLGPDPANGC